MLSCILVCAGNAPTLMSLKHLKKVAPTWMNTSKAIFDDTEAHEVYAAPFAVVTSHAVACALWISGFRAQAMRLPVKKGKKAPRQKGSQQLSCAPSKKHRYFHDNFCEEARLQG